MVFPWSVTFYTFMYYDKIKKAKMPIKQATSRLKKIKSGLNKPQKKSEWGPMKKKRHHQGPMSLMIGP